MFHTYTGEQLAIRLFRELNWQTVSTSEEIFSAGGTPDRKITGELVLMASSLSNQLKELLALDRRQRVDARVQIRSSRMFSIRDWRGLTH